MKLGIFAAVVAIALLIWLAVLEDRKWQAFKVEQNCKVVSHTRSTVNPGFGVMSNGQIGMITTTTPSKTGWLCDDGVIYYR